MRISDFEKREMLEEVLQRHKPLSTVAREHNMSVSPLCRLVQRARINGIESVLHCNTRWFYGKEIKLEVINRVKAGESYYSISKDLNLSDVLVRKWFLSYSEGGTEQLFKSHRGRAKMKKPSGETSEELAKLKARNAELEKELKQARMENAFLKKLDALVRERIKRESGR